MASCSCFRTALVGLALRLWWEGRAAPGDIAYVLTTYFVVNGYLRDIGQQIHRLQRGVNEMEELVALEASRPESPMRRTRGHCRHRGRGPVRERDLPLRRPGHAALRGSCVIPAGQRVGLVGHSGSGKTTFVKLIQRLYEVTGRPDHYRRSGHRPGNADVAAAADGDRAAGAGSVSPLACGEHRATHGPEASTGADRARGASGQCARFHRAVAEGLRNAGRRARREAFRRGAAARGAGARLPRRCADPRSSTRLRRVWTRNPRSSSSRRWSG